MPSSTISGYRGVVGAGNDSWNQKRPDAAILMIGMHRHRRERHHLVAGRTIDHVGAAQHHVPDDLLVEGGDERELGPVARIGPERVHERDFGLTLERAPHDVVDCVEVGGVLGSRDQSVHCREVWQYADQTDR